MQSLEELRSQWHEDDLKEQERAAANKAYWDNLSKKETAEIPAYRVPPTWPKPEPTHNTWSTFRTTHPEIYKDQKIYRYDPPDHPLINQNEYDMWAWVAMFATIVGAFFVYLSMHP